MLPITTTAAPSFSFGPPPTSTTPAQAPGFSFGSTSTEATTPKLGFSTPTTNQAGSVSTAPSFSFGTPATTTFGATASPSTPASTIAVKVTTSAPAPTFASTTTAPATTTTSSFSFGTSLGTSTSTTVAASTTSGIPTKISAIGTQLNLTTATKTTESSIAATVPPAPTVASVSYNQLEEYINKWTLELEEQEKVFSEQASQINAWDQLLMSNNQKILELNKSVQKVKAEQETLEQELEFISTQHTELEESIAPLQKEFDKIPQMDVERTQVYMTVESLDTQLKQMSEDLKEVIVNLNEANKCQDNSDPITQIGKILNAHMSSLQWIESTSSAVSAKLDDLSKMHESFKRESERSFRSAYYN